MRFEKPARTDPRACPALARDLQGRHPGATEVPPSGRTNDPKYLIERPGAAIRYRPPKRGSRRRPQWARRSNPTGRKSKMTRNLKALGLALLAVFAFGAVAAAAASASSFGSEKEKTVITAGEDKAGAEFGTKTSTLKITCNETINGTVIGATATKITAHPTYFECKDVSGLKVSVDTEGCDYILYAETTKHPKTKVEEGEETDAPVEIECTKTEPKPGEIVQDHIKITFKSGATTVCTITITSINEKLHGVTYDNEGSGTTRDIKVTPTVDNIKYDAPGIGCAIGGLKSSGTDGFLTKDETGQKGITATGFEDKDAKEPEPHQDAFSEGSQVGIFWTA
jgi:hypothetical protein